MTTLLRFSLLTLAASLAASNLALAQDALTRRASWTAPPAAEIKARLDLWLAERGATDAQRQQIEAIWQADTGAADPTANLVRLADSAAVVWPEASAVVDQSRQSRAHLPLPQFEILAANTAGADNEPAGEEPVAEEPVADEPADDNHATAHTEESAESHQPWIVDNLRLYYARWLAQHELYDESLALIEPLQPEQVVDPASLLFYQSAAYHFLLNKGKGLAAIEKLLENEESIARRYSVTARLMAADLTPLETDSLDEISRLMDDIERRLRLQRAGTKVRQEEDDVVAKLDKMIEDLEEQQQQQQQGGGGAGNSNSPSQPMQDSHAGGASGEGNVDPKRLEAGENWGNLPPKERQEALQLITKELPAHYREAVEEYFRKLARDGVNP